ncbi:MAG: hypothetical protein ACK5KO_05715 [Arachnia sp.]
MPALDVLVAYVPQPDTDRVLEALFVAGAGRLGNYDRCAFVAAGRGQFRPLAGADPAIGAVGALEYVAEDRVEVSFPRELGSQVVAVLLDAHPYETPAFHVLRTVDEDSA